LLLTQKANTIIYLFIYLHCTLNTDNSRTEIEKILQDDMIIIMSHLYVIEFNSPRRHRSVNLKQMWENDFAVNISREDWDLVWDHAKRISLCNSAIQF